MGLQRDLGHFRDQPADGVTIRTDGEVRVGQHVFQFQSIDDREDTLQQALGHLESNEVMVLLRSITIVRYLHGVEAKLGFQVRGFVLRVPD